ncbi:MAG TPA: transporter [Desulfobaccales bacterium]
MTAKVRIIVVALILTAMLALCRSGAAKTDPTPPITAGPIIADTAVPIATGHFALQPFWGLSFTGGNFSRSWRATSAGGDYASFVTLLRLTYGPVENVEIYAAIPATQNWAGGLNRPEAGNRAADFGGLGDILLVGKYQLFPETDRRPAITPTINVTFPTGHAAHLNPGRLGTDDLGSGAYTFSGGLLLSKWLSPFYLYANLYYGLPTQAPSRVKQNEFGPLLPGVMNRGQISFNLAGEWVLSRRWVALLEFYSTWEVGPLIGRRNGPPAMLLSLLPGLEFILSPRLNLEAGLAVDLAGKNSPYNLTPIVTAIFNF